MGAQVVSYTYDSWGKLVSIDGSLKDNVGVKNPYRYRGYRYDTETGLYYLQSRYYNPEWGRFLNADGITGVKGELLSHNMFAYCDNNAINHLDPVGFRKLRVDFEETDYVGQALEHIIKDKVTETVGTNIGNATCSVVDSSIGKGADKIVSNVTIPIDYVFSTPKIARVGGAVGKVGVLNTICFGLNVRDNFTHYQTSAAIGRTFVDAFGFVATIVFACLTAPLWAPTIGGFLLGTAAGVIAGLGINYVTGLIKDNYLDKKK